MAQAAAAHMSTIATAADVCGSWSEVRRWLETYNKRLARNRRTDRLCNTWLIAGDTTSFLFDGDRTRD